ncbi:MAG: hypothetical protein J0I79_28875 [Mesorhizobium sp.]|uniref:hypothetical protein n=1 Tax=Mesorhizobium sp. TaxID=1871066 RepID=UPI001AC4B1AE|nr:hypothetical protein [Mesorhizobium sp.]MBN9221973.1 hypothetical protein [Mesorhizobium sp.]
MAMIVAEEARLKRVADRQLKKSISRLLLALRRELESPMKISTARSAFQLGSPTPS